MLTTYRDVLSRPGAALFSVTGLWSRLPLSMAGLGIVLLVQERTGSYGEAGLLAASYVLSAAAFGPVQGRLADRLGQAAILWAVGALYAGGMALLLLAIDANWSGVGLHLCAILTGMATPQTGSMVRARWTHAVSDRSQLNTAFSIEAILDEAVFIIGPVTVTFLTLHVNEYSGLVVAASAALLGSWALAAQRATAPQTDIGSTTTAQRMPWRVLGPIVAVSIGLGIVFGSAEVIVVAFATEQQQRGAAGAVLAIWAAGSLVAGLAVGALPQPRSPVGLMRLTLLALGLLFAPLGFSPDVGWLATGMFLGGFMISPTLIAMVNVIEDEVPSTRLTEALAWTTTGMAVGVAPGAAAAGATIDAYGASAGFWVPMIAGLAGAGIAWCIRTSPR